LVVVASKLSVHPLPASGSATIGRSPECDIPIDDPSVSRRHARLLLDPPLRIEDLGSANGVRLRAPSGEAPRTAKIEEIRVQPGEAHPLRVGDAIGLGVAALVIRAAEPKAQASAEERGEGGFIVHDPAMRKLHELAARVAQGPISVLLLGETGVGKEVLAEVVHRSSPRRAAPFLRLNCAALSESLLESELFGHEKGAFTGAAQAKPGLLETADGGTVFLDEVGELTPALQVKLLRVLEERKVTRVGALTARSLDVRFIAATNRDLDAEAKRGAFRQDLYFRLGGITLTIPSLRERRAEIEPLALFFAARAAAALDRPTPTLTRAAAAALERHPWPGNARELRNVMDRAVVLSETGEIAPDDLLLEPPSAAAAASIEAAAPAAAAKTAPPPSSEKKTVTPPHGESLRAQLDDLERQRILEALAACAGNQTQAAAALGMSRRTFISRIDGYGIPRPRKR
jgi:two-component system, NtrC family, response regulator AtoC